MEKPCRFGKLPVIRIIVVFLGTVAFSCSLAAEFKKAKVNDESCRRCLSNPSAKDMKLDGSLCSLPRSSAFGLGIAAAVCLSIAQIVGTSAVGSGLCLGENKARRSRTVSIILLVSSWISFGFAIVILATGSSMNGGQPYGKGWMDGKCYIVKNGAFIGAAMLVVTTVFFLLGFTFTTGATIIHLRTDTADRGGDHRQHKVTEQVPDDDAHHSTSTLVEIRHHTAR